LGPKLLTVKQQKIGDKTLEIIMWKNPKDWTQDEFDICTKYYQLQAKKHGMNIERYMREFH